MRMSRTMGIVGRGIEYMRKVALVENDVEGLNGERGRERYDEAISAIGSVFKEDKLYLKPKKLLKRLGIEGGQFGQYVSLVYMFEELQPSLEAWIRREGGEKMAKKIAKGIGRYVDFSS